MPLIPTHNPKALIIKLNKVEQRRAVVIARQPRSESGRDVAQGRFGLGAQWGLVVVVIIIVAGQCGGGGGEEGFGECVSRSWDLT